MVFEKKMSVKDLIEQMREELKKEQDEVTPFKATNNKIKKKLAKKVATKKIVKKKKKK
jgi:regulator of replication initiation timing